MKFSSCHRKLAVLQPVITVRWGRMLQLVFTSLDQFSGQSKEASDLALRTFGPGGRHPLPPEGHQLAGLFLPDLHHHRRHPPFLLHHPSVHIHFLLDNISVQFSSAQLLSNIHAENMSALCCFLNIWILPICSSGKKSSTQQTCQESEGWERPIDHNFKRYRQLLAESCNRKPLWIFGFLQFGCLEVSLEGNIITAFVILFLSSSNTVASGEQTLKSSRSTRDRMANPIPATLQVCFLVLKKRHPQNGFYKFKYAILANNRQDRPLGLLPKEQMLKKRKSAQRMKHILVLYPSYYQENNV